MKFLMNRANILWTIWNWSSSSKNQKLRMKKTQKIRSLHKTRNCIRIRNPKTSIISQVSLMARKSEQSETAPKSWYNLTNLKSSLLFLMWQTPLRCKKSMARRLWTHRYQLSCASSRTCQSCHKSKQSQSSNRWKVLATKKSKKRKRL
jgi:hypothetical protein